MQSIPSKPIFHSGTVQRYHACILLLLLLINTAQADQLRIAIASNFAEPATALAGQFEQQSAHTLLLSFGSTSKHYAQIIHGAPFDLFFAADTERPQRLEQEGYAIAGTRFTYAIGRLVLWSPKPGLVDAQGQVLARDGFRHLAIANPRLAPYGIAAQQVLQARNLWTVLQDKLVRGENIAQTYQFVSSGNAELGFIAYSQIKRPQQTLTGSIWEVPENLYQPIAQQAVLLRDTPAARAFIDFVRHQKSLQLIRDYGYDVR